MKSDFLGITVLLSDNHADQSTVSSKGNRLRSLANTSLTGSFHQYRASAFAARGLASIVFAIMVLNESLPGGRFISGVVVCTVFFSLIAHGISAKPLGKSFGQKEAEAKRAYP
jgi:NhaP-type Na+/H+ or K+/H+ antiporter